MICIPNSTINLFMTLIIPYNCLTTATEERCFQSASWIHISIEFQPRALCHSSLNNHVTPPWTTSLLPGSCFAWESLTTPVNHSITDARVSSQGCPCFLTGMPVFPVKDARVSCQGCLCFLSGMPVFPVNKKWFDVFRTNRHLVFFPLSPVPLGYRDNLSHVAPHDIFFAHTSLCV